MRRAPPLDADVHSAASDRRRTLRRAGHRWAAIARRLPRVTILAVLVLGIAGAAVWRAPELGEVVSSLSEVQWSWAAAAITANLVSVGVRGAAWLPVLGAALPRRPSAPAVLSAYCIGQLGNALLPGRIGELAKMALLSQRTADPGRSWPAVAGTILTHRLLDAVPLAGLAVFVLVATGIPGWAVTTVAVAVALAVVALVAAAAGARRDTGDAGRGGRLRTTLVRATRGLAVLRSARAAGRAVLLLSLGWVAEVLGAWFTLRAFGIDVGFEAAGVVVLATAALMAFPFWPGNVGLLQAGVALALAPWDVAYTLGVAAGIGLQAVEFLSAAGPGVVALGAEGLTLGSLTSLGEQGLADVAPPPDLAEHGGTHAARGEGP